MGIGLQALKSLNRTGIWIGSSEIAPKKIEYDVVQLFLLLFSSK